MRYWPLLICIALSSTNSAAQFGSQTDQRQADQAKLQQMQNDLDIARMRAETERMTQAVERMRAESEAERKTEEFNQLLRQRASEEAKKAEEAADELREEINLASVRAYDLTFLALSFVILISLGIFIAKRTKDGIMKYEQKFGVVLMVCATLLVLLAIMISDGWSTSLDAIQNIQLALRIKLFRVDDYPPYLIDIPTKYVLVFIAAIVAYGFTTYLGITPPWKKSATIPVNQESASEK